MTTILEDMQFELLPSMTAVSGQVFGIGADVEVADGGFLPGDDDWADEDQDNPRRGGTNFGRDTLLGPKWGFDLHVNEDDVSTALATLGTFKSAWRALKIRQTPNAILPLRYQLDGRVRRVYGRPRRFAAPPDNLILSGYIPITTDFQCADGFTYDDVEEGITLGLQVGSQGGFVFDPDDGLVFPYATIPVGIQTGQAIVSGDAPTYPVVRFNGPVTNPILETAEWNLSLTASILEDEYIEVDLRPWAMTVLHSDGGSRAGSLGRRQYLADMFLDPGQHTLTFRGNSFDSSATCAVRWSNAHNSI